MRTQDEFLSERPRNTDEVAILDERISLATERLSLTCLAATVALAFFADCGHTELFSAALVFAFLSFAFFWTKTTRLRGTVSVLVLFSSVIFVPWVLFLLVGAIFSGTFPMRAEFSLAMNLIPLLVVFVAEQQSRGRGEQTSLLGFVCVAVCVEFFAEIFVKYLSPDHVATIGAHESVLVEICVLFVTVALFLRREVPLWARMVCFYCALGALAAIIMCGDFSSLIALCAGVAVLALFAIKNSLLRFATVAAIICAVAVSPLFIEPEIPVLQNISPPESTEFQGAPAMEQTSSAVSGFELPKIALEIFTESPIFGVGSGTFPEEFQKRVSASQWQVRPANAGNLYLNVLAENGLFGAILLFAPIAWIFVCGIKACVQSPWQEIGGPHHRLRLSETRAVLAPALSCGSALAIYFLLAFPPVGLGAFVVLAVFGGIILRELRWEKFSKTLPPVSVSRRRVLTALSTLFSALVAAVLLPCVLARTEFSKGMDGLSVFLEQGLFKNTSYIPSDSPKDLEAVKEHFLYALALRGNDADSWTALAQVYALSANFHPEDVTKFSELIGVSADNALKFAPDFPTALLWKAVAQVLAGNDYAASETLRRAEAIAPKNAPLMLQISEVYRMISPESEEPLRICDWLGKVFPESEYVKQKRALTELFRESKSHTNGGVEYESVDPKQDGPFEN